MTSFSGRLQLSVPAQCRRFHLFMIILFLLLALPAGCAAAAADSQTPNHLSLIVTSDLHYTVSESISDIVIPGMAYIEEITDAMVADVIGSAPDVFIMTGDNTNSGDPVSEARLARKLQKIKDAGIRVIMTTGNHDFNKSDPGTYADAFSDLFVMDDEDPASLSYISVVGGYAFFAMDDNAVTLGAEGRFSDETMQWLESMLEKYRDKTVIFLSHHTVVMGMDSDSASSYRINNEKLPGLLSKYGVHLILCGHLHSQSISRAGDLYEIISSMPIAGNHTIGLLEIDPHHVRYRTRPIDFETYADAQTAAEIARQDQKYGDFYADSLAGLISRSSFSAYEQKKILDLTKRFFVYYTAGTLLEHRQEIQGDPAYDGMIDALWDYNYGPWMKSTMDSLTMSSSHLDFDY